MQKEVERIFIDLDEVLVDFVGSAYNLLFGDYSKASVNDCRVFLELLNNNKSYRDTAFDQIKKEGPEWWTNLPKLAWADELVAACKQQCDEVYVLTDPGPISEAATGKWQWAIENGFDGHIILVRNKSILASPKSLLIDDRRKYILPWVDKGGKGLRLKRSWRDGFGYSPKELISLLKNGKMLGSWG